jgi:hypothetical protein
MPPTMYVPLGAFGVCGSPLPAMYRVRTTCAPANSESRTGRNFEEVHSTGADALVVLVSAGGLVTNTNEQPTLSNEREHNTTFQVFIAVCFATRAQHLAPKQSARRAEQPLSPASAY